MAGSSSFTRRAALGTTLAAAAGGPGSSAAADPSGARERVLGIGGFFFRAKDPKALVEWYDAHLGVAPVPKSYDGKAWQTEAGVTVFAPFKEDTTYLGERDHQWMLNFRVRDLDRMAAQLRAAGIAVDVDPQAYPNGRFAHLHDPEGNRIELWQPAGKA